MRARVSSCADPRLNISLALNSPGRTHEHRTSTLSLAASFCQVQVSHPESGDLRSPMLDAGNAHRRMLATFAKVSLGRARTNIPTTIKHDRLLHPIPFFRDARVEDRN